MRIATGVYALALALASLLPSGTAPLGGWDAEISPSLQNALHVPAYALLAVLACSLGTRQTLWQVAWFGLACILFGGLLEFAQAWLPGRTGSTSDALLNAIGAACGALVAVAWRRLRKTRTGTIKDPKQATRPTLAELR